MPGKPYYERKDGTIETPTGRHAVRRGSDGLIELLGKRDDVITVFAPWEAIELAEAMQAALDKWQAKPLRPSNLCGASANAAADSSLSALRS